MNECLALRVYNDEEPPKEVANKESLASYSGGDNDSDSDKWMHKDQANNEWPWIN